MNPKIEGKSHRYEVPPHLALRQLPGRRVGLGQGEDGRVPHSDVASWNVIWGGCHFRALGYRQTHVNLHVIESFHRSAFEAVAFRQHVVPLERWNTVLCFKSLKEDHTLRKVQKETRYYFRLSLKGQPNKIFNIFYLLVDLTWPQYTRLDAILNFVKFLWSYLDLKH